MTTTLAGDEAVVRLKGAHRSTWAAGDYDSVARHIDRIPPAHLLAAVGISPGHRVLDVATGSGNVAIRAARAGAQVTGVDLVPQLLETGWGRAQEAGVEIAWAAGDAEGLPFGDAEFDRVLSVFGVQFAPRHRVVAEELSRVCMAGGAIGLVNWTPEGLIGQTFRILSGYMPSPPPFASPPPLGVTLAFERGTNPFRFPSVDSYMTFFEGNYGPMLKTKETLASRGTWDDCRAELRELYESSNLATDGSLHVESEYLVVIARRD